MSDLTQELHNEIKALKDEIAAPFNEKMRRARP